MKKSLIAWIGSSNITIALAFLTMSMKTISKIHSVLTYISMSNCTITDLKLTLFSITIITSNNTYQINNNPIVFVALLIALNSFLLVANRLKRNGKFNTYSQSGD